MSGMQHFDVYSHKCVVFEFFMLFLDNRLLVQRAFNASKKSLTIPAANEEDRLMAAINLWNYIEYDDPVQSAIVLDNAKDIVSVDILWYNICSNPNHTPYLTSTIEEYLANHDRQATGLLREIPENVYKYMCTFLTVEEIWEKLFGLCKQIRPQWHSSTSDAWKRIYCKFLALPVDMDKKFDEITNVIGGKEIIHLLLFDVRLFDWQVITDIEKEIKNMKREVVGDDSKNNSSDKPPMVDDSSNETQSGLATDEPQNLLITLSQNAWEIIVPFLDTTSYLKLSYGNLYLFRTLRSCTLFGKIENFKSLTMTDRNYTNWNSSRSTYYYWQFVNEMHEKYNQPPNGDYMPQFAGKYLLYLYTNACHVDTSKTPNLRIMVLDSDINIDKPIVRSDSNEKMYLVQCNRENYQRFYFHSRVIVLAHDGISWNGLWSLMSQAKCRLLVLWCLAPGLIGSRSQEDIMYECPSFYESRSKHVIVINSVDLLSDLLQMRWFHLRVGQLSILMRGHQWLHDSTRTIMTLLTIGLNDHLARITMWIYVDMLALNVAPRHNVQVHSGIARLIRFILKNRNILSKFVFCVYFDRGSSCGGDVLDFTQEETRLMPHSNLQKKMSHWRALATWNASPDSVDNGQTRVVLEIFDEIVSNFL